MQEIKGFTLIELMIVVAIIGILAAIGYPSYQESVRKSNRTEAKVDLADFAQRLQKCFTAYGRYDDPNNKNLCPAYETLKVGNVKSKGNQYYKVTISDDTAITYTLTATADKAPQTADTRNGCDVLTLNHRGERSPAVCW